MGEEKDLSSLFLAGLFPLSDPNGFKTLYDQFRKDHPGADHYPYALCLGELNRSSDDGEPGGTAGRPMLSLLLEKEIDGVLIVARHFGGTKLGVPRLRRAFLSSAEQAIAHARFGVYQEMLRYDVEVDYPTYEILRNGANRGLFSLQNPVFDIKVHAEIRSGDRLDGLLQRLGLYGLELGEPRIERVLEEVTV